MTLLISHNINKILHMGRKKRAGWSQNRRVAIQEICIQRREGVPNIIPSSATQSFRSRQNNSNNPRPPSPAPTNRCNLQALGSSAGWTPARQAATCPPPELRGRPTHMCPCTHTHAQTRARTLRARAHTGGG